MFACADDLLWPVRLPHGRPCPAAWRWHTQSMAHRIGKEDDAPTESPAAPQQADALFSVAVIQPGDSSTAGSILSLLVLLLHIRSL